MAGIECDHLVDIITRELLLVLDAKVVQFTVLGDDGLHQFCVVHEGSY